MPPKLPSSQNISRPGLSVSGRASYSGTRQTAPYVTSGLRAADVTSTAGAGMRALAGAADDIKVELKKQKDERDRYELTSAKSTWAKQQLEIEKQFLEDTDYATLSDRKMEAYNSARMAAGGVISDDKLRAAFMADSDVDMVRNQLNTMEEVKRKNDSQKAAILTDKINANQIALSETVDEERRADIIRETTAMHNQLIRLNVSPSTVAASKRGFLKQAQKDKFAQISDYSERVKAIKASEGVFTASEKEDMINDAFNDEVGELMLDDVNELQRKLNSDRYEDADAMTRAKLKDTVRTQIKRKQLNAQYDRIMDMTTAQKDMYDRHAKNELTWTELQDYKRAAGDDQDALAWVEMMEQYMNPPETGPPARTDAEKMAKRAEMWAEFSSFKKTVRGQPTEASMSEAKRFMAKIPQYYAEGYFTGRDGDQFNSLIPVMQEMIEDSHKKDWWGLGPRKKFKDDTYSSAYDYVLDYAEANPQFDTPEMRDSMISRIVAVADSMDIHKAQDSAERDALIDSVGKTIARDQILSVAPELKNVEEWPAVHTRPDGSVINIPPGLAKGVTSQKVEVPEQSVGAPPEDVQSLLDKYGD